MFSPRTHHPCMGHGKPNLVAHGLHVVNFNHLFPCMHFFCLDYIKFVMKQLD